MRRVALVLAATLACVHAYAEPADWAVEHDPFDRAVIARYKTILARDPYDSVLAPLAAMYRGYRTLALLESEYADDWSGLVVRARLAKLRDARAEALGLWKRALAIDPHDTHGWLAFGELATPDELARAYADAAPPIEREVLRAVALAPKRYLIRDELLARIIAIHRERHTLPELVRDLETLWPRHARGYPEWSLFGDLYAELKDDARAIEAWQRVVARAPNDLAAHRTLIALYDRAGRRDDLARRECEQIATLEMAEQHIRAGTAKAYALVGEIFTGHRLWADAEIAYGEAIKRDRDNPALWSARAAMFEARGVWPHALSDARHAVALIGAIGRGPGHAIRSQLVRLTLHADVNDMWTDLASIAEEWRRAFDDDPPDLAAGYLLAELPVRDVATLERLHELVPGDRDVTIDLVRMLRTAGDYDRAHALAAELAAAEPDNDETKQLLARIDVERKRPRPSIQDPELEIRRIREPARTPAIGGGLRIGVGGGVRGSTRAGLTVGALARFGSGSVRFVARTDFAQREVEMSTVSAIAVSVGVSARLFATRDLAVALGAAQRFEGRGKHPGVDPIGVAADATLDVVVHHAVLGARLEQALSEHARNTALYFELGVELP